MSENRLSSLIKDLSKAKQQALLIEVLQSDLESLSGQNDDAFKTVCNASAKVFDVAVKSGKTNVLMVGEAQDQAHLSIFGALLNSLDEEFDDLHKRAILKKLTVFGLSQSLGGGVGDAVSESLGVGAEKMMDYLAEWTGSASDFIASAFEKGVETAAEQSGDLLEAAGETGVEAVTGYFSSDNELYLSRPARKRLKELAPRLSEQATNHEILQLALEMLLATAQGAPKVIMVKDPTQLDDASLALLAMLVAVEKDLRQLNHDEEADEGKAQTAGITVVLTFSGRQPHDEGEDKVTEKKLRAISRLRMMASRYSLLERLDSDIPIPAVRASTFVGREAELRSLWQDWNHISKGLDGEGMQTWALIKGEPGTGKTALANRFIQQVRSDTANPGRLSIPILRMLNQTGHNAQATGLASLKNSIVDELRRLNLIYEENVGWFARTREKLGDASRAAISDAKSEDPEAKERTRGRLGGLISKLLNLDSAMEVGRSVQSLRKQDEMSSLRQEEFDQSFKANQKKEQYELLRGALSEMSQLAHKCLPEADDQTAEKPRPMILMVDDLQWMDDFTAEFLVKEWPANLPVYVIATARGSDSFAAVTESRVHQGLNRFRNSLFAELGVIDAATLSADERLNTPLTLAGHLDLKGMDQPMLANLIRLTYRNITAEQAEPFAAAIIRNLAGEAGASDIITLFAIETLNVISDPQFYRRNAELPRLIEPEGTDRYRFKVPESTNLTQALDAVFKKLTDAYQASYLIDSEQGTGGARFNLASYAILEERLHLIEQHFGEHGGAARYSLLFSALLGSPFESGLVRHVLDELQQLSPQDHPDMAPFLKELQAKAQGSLGPAQYEILERAYEIIRRLEEDIGKYAHQHSLLRQFLLGQFTRLLDNTYPNLETLDVSAKALFDLISHIGNAWFTKQSQEIEFEIPGESATEIEKLRFNVSITAYWHQLMLGKTQKLGDWSKVYAQNINTLATALRKIGHPEKALRLYEEERQICFNGYVNDAETWKRDYARSLNDLGKVSFFMANLIISEHKKILEEAHRIRLIGYQENSYLWAEDYVDSLNVLGRFYRLTGDIKTNDGVYLHDEAVSICKGFYKLERSGWDFLYAYSLILRGQHYIGMNRPEMAQSDLEDAFLIQEKGFSTYRTLWAEGYVDCCIALSKMHCSRRNYKESVKFGKWATKVCEEGYKKAPNRWALLYIESMENLGIIYKIFGRFDDALFEYKASLDVSLEQYNPDIDKFVEECARGYDHVAELYEKKGQWDKYALAKEKSFRFYSDPNDADGSKWFQDVARICFHQANTMRMEGELDKALDKLEKACALFGVIYNYDNNKWGLEYANCLSSIGFLKNKLGFSDEAINYHMKSIEIFRLGERNGLPDWDKFFFYGLRNYALCRESLSELSYAVDILQEANLICKRHYSWSERQWSSCLVDCLRAQAEILKKMGRLSEAIEISEEADRLLT